MSNPNPTEKTINTPLLGKKEPTQCLGVMLSNFSVSYNIFFSGEKEHPSCSSEKEEKLNEKIITIRKKIYFDIVDNLGKLSNFNSKEEGVKTTHYFEEYKDYWLYFNYKGDCQRWVIRIIRKTPRSTEISTLCRFYANGTNLYIGVDSFLLGKTRIYSLSFHALLSCYLLQVFGIGILGVWGILESIASNPLLIFSFPFILIPTIFSGLYLYTIWFPVVEAIFYGQDLITALKYRFQNKKIENLFDKDDVLAYLKSLLPFILERVKTVLAEEGIDNTDVDEKLDRIIESVKEQKMVVNNSGLMFGIQFGSNNIQENRK